jgi:hypothetical protein
VRSQRGIRKNHIAGDSKKAFEMGDSGKQKLMALDDPDLEPLWGEISEI